MKRNASIESIRRAKHKPKEQEEVERLFLSTGSTLLNLALSDNPRRGYQSGKLVNLVGDSSSGKSLIVLTAFAEACRDSRFDGYNLIYDDAEHACEFDIAKLFGQSTAERIIPPRGERDDPIYSRTVEDFHLSVSQRIRSGKPFVYVLDSLDSISSKGEQESAEKRLDAMENGKEAKGTYGMSKAKAMSEILRLITGDLAKTKSILIIISQTRDNIDPFTFETKTRAGGKALRFYSTHEAWSAVAKRIKSKDRQVGVQTVIRIKKNKVTGKEREIEMPLLIGYGIDDMGSCIDFLLKEKAWKGDANKMQTTQWGAISRRALLKELDGDKTKTKVLIKEVAALWAQIEKDIEPGRSPRYA